MPIKKTMSLLLILMLAVSLLAGCQSNGTTPSPVPTQLQTPEATPTEGVLVPPTDPAAIEAELSLYTSEPEELVSEMITDFNKTYPNVTINLFRSGTGKVTAKIDTELETGSTEANILWFADIGYMNALDDQGLILHYTPAAAASVSPEYAYRDGMAHEVRLIYSVLAYNTTLVSTPPNDWNDITTPDYKGKFAMANPNYSGGAFTALVVHVQNEDKVGWAFYDNAKANEVKFEESNGNLQTKVSNGEYKAVVIVDFMARNAKRDGSPVEVVYPASGAVLIPTPISMVSNMSDEQALAAKAFIDYMYTTSTQQLFVQQGYIPVMSDAGVPEGAPAAAEIVTMPFDLEYYVAHATDIRNEYVQKFGE